MKMHPIVISIALCLMPHGLGQVINADSGSPVRGAHTADNSKNILQDPVSKNEFLITSKGHHVMARSFDGKTLWDCEPFMERPESTRASIISLSLPTADWWRSHVQLGKQADFIIVSFSSAEFGVLNKITGKFTYLGGD